MKKKTLLIVGAIIIVIIAVIFIFPTKYENKFKDVTYNKESNLFVNRTDATALDTIYHKGFEILGIKNQRFLIAELTDDNTKSIFGKSLKLTGSVSKQTDFLLIKTKLGSIKSMISIAAHELIHVQQYLSNRLEFEMALDRVRWEDDYFYLPIKYEDVPWEKEAYKKARALEKLMIEALLIEK